MSLEGGTASVAKMREILLRHPEIISVVSQHGRPDNGSDASPFSNVEIFAPLKPFDEWPAGLTKDKLTEERQEEFSEELPELDSISRNTYRTMSRRRFLALKARTRSKSLDQILRPLNRWQRRSWNK
jgi:Cu/Ag efflux pump CusA